MSDTDSDVPVKRRVAKKKAPALKKAAKRKQPIKSRQKGKPRQLISSESDSDSSSEKSDSSRSESNNETDSGVESEVQSESEESKGDPDQMISTSGFQLPGSDEQPKVWVFVGVCASGKTHMLKYIQYLYAKKQHFKWGCIYTGTKFTGDYGWAPERSVLDFDEEHFMQYVKSMRSKVEEGVANYGSDFKLPHNFVIFDDNNGVLSQSPFMINFISTHRHTSTTVFVLSQLLTARGAVSTTMRANTSYALMWPSANHIVIKSLFDNFGGLFQKRADFAAALNSCGKRPYSCLVLKNSTKHRTIAEQFTCIKAGEFPKDFEIKF